ncbi:hypothetical protein QAD02_011763 [Eretmocerus hayati]|uniref:Uncharacterized protein n=1 Tax=Eretmocerus hayati TaxID=131215 RepID=A0ACC2NXX7_9HYME|nr:hypothetical protein QAD02_011763 [Eretmocerus hayati]
MNDGNGLVALDIAIDILGGSTHTQNTCSPRPESVSRSPSHSYICKSLPSSSASTTPISSLTETPENSKSLPDPQKINQISINSTNLPDLLVTKPVKKLNLEAYRERKQTPAKKKWTRQDCIDEYANRACLREARDLQIPKKSPFSPICQPRSTTQKSLIQLPSQSPVDRNPNFPIHNNELIPENLDFDPVDSFTTISKEFDLAWELGLLSPPIATRDAIPAPSIAQPREGVSSRALQGSSTDLTSSNVYTIDNDPNYDHFPLFKNLKELIDHLARPISPPQTAEDLRQTSSASGPSSESSPNSSDSTPSFSTPNTSSCSSESSPNSSDSTSSSSTSNKSGSPHPPESESEATEAHDETPLENNHSDGSESLSDWSDRPQPGTDLECPSGTIIETKELVSYREDNILCFVSTSGKPCDVGATDSLERNKIPPSQTINHRELSFLKRSNNEYIFCLCIKTDEAESQCIVENSIYKTLLKLRELMIDKNLTEISISKSENVYNVPWQEVKNSLIAAFRNTKIKIIVCKN